MTSEDLLRQLGRLAREEEGAARDDARWERLAAGELSAEERAALERAAEGDDAIAQKLEAYRPLDDALKAKIAARMALSAATSSSTRPAARERASVVPIPLWRRMAVVAVPLAAAAAVALWIGSERRREELASVDAPAPDYTLVVRGGDRAQRSAADEPADRPLELRSGSRFELVLRPATRAPGAPSVHGALVRDGEARPWSPPMERSSDGAVRISGMADALFEGASAGPWLVVLAVGPEPSLPRDARALADAATAGAGGGRGWQLLTTRVVLAAPP